MSTQRKLNPELQAMLHKLASADVPTLDESQEVLHPKIAALRSACKRIHSTDPTQFRPGDLVRWQPGLKYAKWPLYGQTAVVIECLDPPYVGNDRDSGSPYFRDPLSLVLGLQHEGGFHCWHYDGRRFERV